MYSTIQAAARAIAQREATPIDLLDQCLRQIDKYEDKVKAWVFVDREHARQQADRLTAELNAGRYRGPLHGIPLGIKDMFDVHDWPTAAGSKLWANSVARQDAVVVAKLRQAGAILLGKTVTTQYCSFDPPVTRNPWDLSRTPGGSSSGSAAALACGMCLGAMGSQTGGSLTRPAAYCGVTSCKPTFGRVSTEGALPLAPSMDHPGPMARCVWDLAVLLQAIDGDSGTDFVSGLNGFYPPRLGRVRGLFDDLATPPVQAMMDDVEKTLREASAEIGNIAMPAAFSEVLTRQRIVMAVEGAAYHETRLLRHPEDYQPNITKLLRDGLACPAPEYSRCKTHQAKWHGTAHWFDSVDALLTPAARDTAPDAATTGDPAFNSPWSYTGLPTVSLPVGRGPDGLPLSIQLVGAPWRERTLLAAAMWCERVLALPIDYPGD